MCKYSFLLSFLLLELTSLIHPVHTAEALGHKSNLFLPDQRDKSIKEIGKRLKHLVLIPDGDRRWAKLRGLTHVEGHHKAADLGIELIEHAFNQGIHTVSFYWFSTATWKRKKVEVDDLMVRIGYMIEKILPIAHNKGIRIIHLGRKDRLPKFLFETIEQAERDTASHSTHIVNFAIDYGGQDEVLRACKKLLDKKMNSKDLSKEVFESELDTASQPYPSPDLIIRASAANEYRLSDFMAWQIPFTEFIFLKKFFPDFTKHDIDNAIIEFGKRKRTLGGD